MLVDRTLPLIETTRTYSGMIVLRPLRNGQPGYMETGDSAHFCFRVPHNIHSIRGVFSFDPWQQAGLQFRHMQPPYPQVASWGGTGWDLVGYPATLLPSSPITLEYPDPPAGRYYTYGGPGILGGQMTWSHDLTMITYGPPTPDDVAAFEAIDPSC